MQRKATKQSRGPNTAERQYMTWLKERCICAACGDHGPVINHHCEGSTCKTRVGAVRVHIGHAFVIGLCQSCDDIVTHGGRKAFRQWFGPQSMLWLAQYESSPVRFPAEVVDGIAQWGK